MSKKLFLTIICLLLGLGLLFSAGAQAAETMPVEVRVWNWNTSQLKKNFLAYPENNRNGADVAIGDFTGDGRQEIAIGAGRNSGPHVRIFSETGALKGLDFFPFKPEYRWSIDCGRRCNR